MPVSVIKGGEPCRPVVDCASQDWKDLVLREISAIHECDLVNFDLNSQGNFCQEAADHSPLEFRPDRDSTVRRASLRRRWK